MIALYYQISLINILLDAWTITQIECCVRLLLFAFTQEHNSSRFVKLKLVDEAFLGSLTLHNKLDVKLEEKVDSFVQTFKF